jgi:hypothetical protein
MTQIALIVHACDRYQLLFEGFYHFFKENGGLDLPIKKYFFTEQLDVHFEGFENIKTGNGQWTDRLANGLNQIESDYIIYFQEDMWLDKPLSNTFLESVYSFINSKNVKLLKLHSSEVYNTEGVGIFIDGLQMAVVNKSKSEYLMSHQVSIWEKKFLLNQLPKNEHPWRNERKGSKRLRLSTETIYQIDYFAGNDNPSINENKHDTIRSHYWNISYNGRLYKNCMPFVEHLIKNENTKTYGEKLLYHYNNQLTHDGKAEPRKVGAFKKLKTYFQTFFQENNTKERT